jgi:hypothetical protein
LVEKPKGKRPFVRPSVDGKIMDLGEIGWEGVDCMFLAQDRDQRRGLVNTVVKLRVP